MLASKSLGQATPLIPWSPSLFGRRVAAVGLGSATVVVLQITACLDALGKHVAEMARHQQVVSRLDPVGKSHKSRGVDNECRRHAATDDVGRCLHILKGSQRKAPVGHRTPEVGAGYVIPELLSLQVVSHFPQ